MQVTIPKSVHDALHLAAGDRLEFLVETDGSIRAIPLTCSVTDLKGLLPPPKQTLSLEEMDTAIVAGTADQ